MTKPESRMNDEIRMTKGFVLRHSSFFRHSGFVILISAVLVGCKSDKHPTTRPTSAYDRQQAALKDPFDYSPNMDGQDISGGGIGNYDKKEMKKDIDHVLNP